MSKKSVTIVILLFLLVGVGAIGLYLASHHPPAPPATLERVAKEPYYSYARTILEGGVIPSMSCKKCGPSPQVAWNGQMFATVGDKDKDNGSPLYQIDYGPWEGQVYVDFDASSGLMGAT